jgi:hypothetical protein
VSARLGVVADIHGNDVALRAVLKDAGCFGVERWWALGDLVLFGPRPAEVLEILRGLPGIGMLRGNTDRYVLTGEQPAPHMTVADAAGSVDLVRRYAGMAAGIGWTRGVLDQAGLLWVLDGLPDQLRLRLPGGADVLGVHASPRADDGQGIEPGTEFVTSILAGPLGAGYAVEPVAEEGALGGGERDEVREGGLDLAAQRLLRAQPGRSTPWRAFGAHAAHGARVARRAGGSLSLPPVLTGT